MLLKIDVGTLANPYGRKFDRLPGDPQRRTPNKPARWRKGSRESDRRRTLFLDRLFCPRYIRVLTARSP